eukprot:TRINITY_DN65762_c14_g1_i1.p1 TRINITY_DN65762_c14_g1~~TRINITY_DN65762_c14_g1_i1.p1  ORF type:complete len:488 (-),score=312.87 TRINITY_DN65762_c14_g1_i1:112-1539(-)
MSVNEALVARLEAAVAKLERLGAGGGAGGAGGDDEAPLVVLDYDAFYADAVQPLVDTCSKIDGLSFGSDLETAFKFVRTTILATTKCKAPSSKELLKFLDPVVKIVTAAQDCDNRSKTFNHDKSFAELIQCMNWLMIARPAGHIQASVESAEFYLNKILVAAKDMDDPDKTTHRNFVKRTKELGKKLAEYVTNNFKSGLTWNANGVPITEFNPSSAGGAAAPPAAPAGAPPPPPVGAFNPNVDEQKSNSSSSGGAGGMGAVFAELSKGAAVTSGLRKVTKDMKTKYRKDAPPVVPKAKPKAAPKPKAAKVKKPATKALNKGTMFVENFDETDEQLLEITDVKIKQNVFISNCSNITIVIKNKVKAITIANSSKLRVFFDSVLSTCELVNSKRIRLFVQESAPTIAVDKTADFEITLNEQSVANPPTIYASSISGGNLLVPGEKADSDPIEIPIPEQYEHKYLGGNKISADSVKHG